MKGRGKYRQEGEERAETYRERETRGKGYTSSDKNKVRPFEKIINFLDLSKIFFVNIGLFGSICLGGTYIKILFSIKLLLKFITK